MRPADEVQIMPLQEALHNILTKCEGDAAFILAPASDFLVGICPEQVAEEAGVGHVSGAGEAADLRKGVGWREGERERGSEGGRLS